MSRYFLSQHSFMCETAGHAVFLDLKRDKYTAVAPEDLKVLRAAVKGWPAAADESGSTTAAGQGTLQAFPNSISRDDKNAREIIDALMKEGLLTADPSAGKDATPAHLDTPTDTFWSAQRLWPQLTSQHLKNFVRTWATTTAMLRTLPIGWIVNRARRRKEKLAPAAPAMDMNKARMLCTIHFVLQPAFYPAKDACLRNSLTLIEFLSKYQIYPTWAYGVRMEPFAAHAWVQAGPVLFTDPIEHVKTFTPIMVI